MFGVADCWETENDGIEFETNSLGDAAMVIGDSGAETTIEGDTVGYSN